MVGNDGNDGDFNCSSERPWFDRMRDAAETDIEGFGGVLP